MVTSAEWQALSADPQASNIVELAKLSREEIAAAFQVPPPILGILERAIRANVTELRSQFLRDVVGRTRPRSRATSTRSSSAEPDVAPATSSRST
jgi:phage portal protein BeeE